MTLGAFSFFTDRLAGHAPLGRVFWQDMLIVGSVLNLSALTAGLIYLSQGGDSLLGMAIIFSVTPYNIFLVMSVWRCAAGRQPLTQVAAKLSSACWLATFFII